ncbi:hypothetical protein KR018_003458, partial [Drosophila ironensis]
WQVHHLQPLHVQLSGRDDGEGTPVGAGLGLRLQLVAPERVRLLGRLRDRRERVHREPPAHHVQLSHLPRHPDG